MWYLQLSGIMIQTSSKEEEERKRKKKKIKEKKEKSRQVGKRNKDHCRFLFPCFSQSLPKLVYLHDAYSI